jgi:hypothetical protein
MKISKFFRLLPFALLLVPVLLHAAAKTQTRGETPATTVKLSDAQAMEIGKRIWKNECAGTIEGLTTWNSGEQFASLGIGHFIWYPVGKTGPFEESFPGLVRYLESQGIKVPAWISQAKGCPWATRAEFQRDFQSPKMKELRTLLAQTVPQQARYAAMRLENALPKMLAAAPPQERDKIRSQFYRVAAQPLGMYALMDYVNFKGEGISPTERYKGQGWGLLQVLQEMGPGDPMKEFSRSAEFVLRRRVQNSPPERNEAKWMPGWSNRCKTYAN